LYNIKPMIAKAKDKKESFGKKDRREESEVWLSRMGNNKNISA